jgi:hypothetical protein
MSTHGTINVFDSDTNEQLIKIYKHLDGFNCEKLIEFIDNISIINGISPDCVLYKHANGPEDFTAQLISYLKNKVGNIYVYPISRPNEEYVYNIYVGYSCVDMEELNNNVIVNRWHFEKE